MVPVSLEARPPHLGSSGAQYHRSEEREIRLLSESLLDLQKTYAGEVWAIVGVAVSAKELSFKEKPNRSKGTPRQPKQPSELEQAVQWVQSVSTAGGLVVVVVRRVLSGQGNTSGHELDLVSLSVRGAAGIETQEAKLVHVTDNKFLQRRCMTVPDDKISYGITPSAVHNASGVLSGTCLLPLPLHSTVAPSHGNTALSIPGRTPKAQPCRCLPSLYKHEAASRKISFCLEGLKGYLRLQDLRAFSLCAESRVATTISLRFGLRLTMSH